MCAFTKLPVPGTVEGISLLSAIKSQAYSQRQSAFFVYKNFQRAVRTQDWKLINYNVKGEKTTQLFYLKNDPYEQHNLAQQQPRKVQEMERVMESWFTKTGDQVVLAKADWGVPEILSWMEQVKRDNPKMLEQLLRLTKEKGAISH